MGVGGTTRPCGRPHPTGAWGDTVPRLHPHPTRRRKRGCSLPGGGRTSLPGAGDTERLRAPASPEGLGALEAQADPRSHAP